MVVHAPEESDTLIQARGRLRDDLKHLYYYDANFPEPVYPIPATYLNRKLSTAERAELCADIRLMKPRGSEHYKWGKVKEFYSQHGYTFEQTTIGHGGKADAFIIRQI